MWRKLPDKILNGAYLHLDRLSKSQTKLGVLYFYLINLTSLGRIPSKSLSGIERVQAAALLFVLAS